VNGEQYDRDYSLLSNRFDGNRRWLKVARFIGEALMKPTKWVKRPESFVAGVGRALRLAAKSARKMARMHGTPIYVSEGGKVVAKRP
jgi:hypothetical protein